MTFSVFQKIGFGLVVMVCVVYVCQSGFVSAVTVKSGAGEMEETLPQVEPQKVSVLGFKINFVYRPAQGERFESLENGSILRSGDRYKIIFTPFEDCHVYIFQVDSADMVYQLFPMKSFGGVTVSNFNPVQAGKTYYLPAEGKSFVLDEQTGTETIFFVTSRKRDKELEAQYQQVTTEQDKASGTVNNQPDQRDQLFFDDEQSRKIVETVTVPDETETTSWQEEGQTFSVIQQRLDNLCYGCVYMLMFEHR